MVEGGNKLWRVQVKNRTCMRDGRYHLGVGRISHRRFVAYKKSKLDFVVAYLMPEQTWYVLPASEVVERRSILLPPRLSYYAEILGTRRHSLPHFGDSAKAGRPL
jgi:hypothetical protein